MRRRGAAHLPHCSSTRRENLLLDTAVLCRTGKSGRYDHCMTVASKVRSPNPFDYPVIFIAMSLSHPRSCLTATHLLLAASWVFASSVFAEVSVKTEQLNPADPAWKFKQIPGPSKSDIAGG